MTGREREAALADMLGAAARHLRAGRLGQAQADARKVLAARPDHAEALHVLAVATARSAGPQAGIPLFERAIAIDKDNPAVHANLGAALQGAGRVREAAAAFRRAIELQPDFAQAHFNLGAALQALGRPDEAAAAYRAALAVRPGYLHAQVNLGGVLEAQGRLEDAAAAYRAALAIDPNLAGAHYNLGGVLDDLGRHDQAAAAYRRAVELRPDLAEAHFNLGGALRALGRLEEALGAYRRALEIKPGLVPALANMGYVLQELGRLDEAISVLEQATHIDPNFAGAYANLGATLREAGRPEEALAAYRRALELRPDSADDHTSMGGVQRALGDLDGAVASHRRAIALRPGFAEAHVNLGIALMQKGEQEAALAACEDCLAREPDNPRVLALKAVVLGELGRRTQARVLVDFDRFIRPVRPAPPPGYAGMAAFNDALVRHILAHPSLVRAPTSHATRNGRHTGELLAEPLGPMADFARMIDAAVADYVRAAGRDPEHPFLARPPARWRLTAWSVVMEAQGHQVPHIHPAWLSGCYYPKVPDLVARSGEAHAGWIEFGRPGLAIPCKAAPEVRGIQPEEGLLVLFPSYFYHHTVPYEADAQRISIAFDVLRAD